jgi:small-conductance mechanosensitive channel
MLIVLRPFRTGDVVEIAGITGVVQQVRLFQTELLSFENHAITLPNGQITNSPITNFTAHPTRRIDVPVGVEYGCDIRAARELLLRLANEVPAVLEDPAPSVMVNELADSSVNLVLRAWVNTPDFAETRSTLIEATHRELPAAGFGIPFPQRDLHLSLDAASAALLGSQAKPERTQA